MSGTGVENLLKNVKENLNWTLWVCSYVTECCQLKSYNIKKKYWYGRVTYVNVGATFWVVFVSNDVYEAQVSQLWNSLALLEYHNAVIWKVWD